MENITCKACQAVVDTKLEFCSSCGEWLGLKIDDLKTEPRLEESRFEKRTRIPQIKCSNCGNNNLSFLLSSIILLTFLVTSFGTLSGQYCKAVVTI